MTGYEGGYDCVHVDDVCVCVVCLSVCLSVCDRYLEIPRPYREWWWWKTFLLKGEGQMIRLMRNKIARVTSTSVLRMCIARGRVAYIYISALYSHTCMFMHCVRTVWV